MAIFSLIGYAFAYAGGFLAAAAGLSFSTAVSVGIAVGRIGIGLAALQLHKALTPKVNIPQAEIQAVINQTDAARRVYVGRALAGGIRAFFHVKGSTLYQLVVVAHGKINSFVEFWIDGEPVGIDSLGGVFTGPKAGYVSVETRDGSAQGGNYPELHASFSSWPISRRLDEQATFLVKASAPAGNDFAKVFPKAYNTVFQWVINGAEVYDPRADGYGFSDNAALVIAHYLTHEGGYRLDPSEVDWDSVAALADWCGAMVPQKGGGSYPRMRLWGYWTMDEEPAQVLERMFTSSGIRPYETAEGKIGLIGGPFGTPAMTLTAKDIRQIQTSAAISERAGFNTLRVLYLSPFHRYEMIEADPWVDTARLAQEGEIAEELTAEMCPNLSQARRLAKRYMHDHNRARIEVVTNTVGLKARYPAAHGQRHTILLDYRPEDGSGRVIQGEYEVVDHEFDPVAMECRIVLEEVDRASESWTTDEEGTLPDPLPATETNTAPGISPVVAALPGSPGVTLVVDALPVPGWPDLTIEAQYQSTAPGSQWVPMAANGLHAQSGVIADGTYNVRARWIGTFDGVAPWATITGIPAVSDPTPPAAPTELIASPGVGYVHLSVRAPAGKSLRIYRGTSSSYGASILIGETGATAGQISEYQDYTAAPGTPYWYWVAASNTSNVVGPAVGPATITL